jgi:FkbM family methyltransferase
MKNIMQRINFQSINMHAVASARRSMSLVPSKERLVQMQDFTGSKLQDLFLAVLDKLDARFLIEIGAHKAEISRLFAQQSSKKAIAFEANPHVHNRYLKELSNPNLEYVNLGISDTKGTTNLYIPKHTPLSWSTESSLSKRSAFSEFTEIEIKVNTLDNIVLEYKVNSRFAIWIDVEGNTTKVIDGAEQTLSSPNCLAIFVEIQDSLLWPEELLAEGIAQKLSKFGFEPVARDFPMSTLFNAIFIKAELIPECSLDISKFWFECSKSRPNIVFFPDIRNILSRFARRFIAILPKPFRRSSETFLKLMGSKSLSELPK